MARAGRQARRRRELRRRGGKFREPITLAQWAAAIAQVRTPLGEVEQRTVVETAFDKVKSDGGADVEIVMFRYPHRVREEDRKHRDRHARARGRRRLARDRLRDSLSGRADPGVAETVALSKFACPACGGEAIWNPGKQKLVCPFCGTESPAKLDAARRDRRARSRRRAARHRRRRARLAGRQRQVKCQSCNAISVLDPARQAQNCEFCGSAQLVPYEETKPAFRPESVLPFRVTEAAARDAIRALVRQAVARADRAQEPRADRHRARRLPAVLDVRRARRRRRGPPRPATTTTRPKPTSRAARRARGRCSTCAGSRRPDGCRISSTTISSARRSASIPDCCAASSRSRRRSSSPTTPASSRAGSSSATRSTSSPPRSARATRWTRSCRRCARSRCPATPIATSQVRADYSGQTFKHILAPVWLLSYTYGARAFQCVMNGVTGAIAASTRRARGRSRCSCSRSWSSS